MIRKVAALFLLSCSSSTTAVTPVIDSAVEPHDSGVVDGGAVEPDSAPDVMAEAAEVAVDAVAAGDCGAFPKIGDLATAGPFGSISATEGPGCIIIRPAMLGAGSVRHPVVVWGNGTTATVSLYKAAFDYWASHGVIVAAANVSDGQGSGKQMLGCLDWVLAQSKTSGSVYEGKVCPRAGATGHSQGGAGALMAGRDPRVVVTAPLQPYTQQGYGGFDRASFDKQIGPMLLLSGGSDDNAVPSVHQKPVFDATNVPVLWATLIGGDHYTPAINGLKAYREVMLAWLRLHLLGDEDWRSLFYGASCGVCVNPKWTVVSRGLK